MKKYSRTHIGHLATFLLIGIASTGCMQSEVKCSDEASTSVALSLVKDILSEQIESEIKQSKSVSDKSKINAFLNDTVMSLSDIRTSKKDPNSTKSFCVANFNAQFSNNTVSDADKTRKSLNFPSTIEYVRQNNLKFEANKLSGSLEYSVQPTDDGKKVYAELIKTQLPLSATAEIIASALLKSILEINAAQQASQTSSLVAAAKAKAELEMQNAKIDVEAAAKAAVEMQTAQRDKELEKSKGEKSQVDLESAKILLKDANDRLNVVWNTATKAQREAALPNQRIWLKQRDFDCKTKSEALFPNDFTAQEARRLKCEAEVTLPREQELKKIFSSSL